MINFSTKQKKRGSCFTAHTSPPNVAIDEYGESRRSVEFFLVCLFVGSLTKAPRGGNVLFTIDRVLYTFFFKIKIFSFSVLDRCRLIRPCFFLFCFLIIFGTAPWRNSTVFFCLFLGSSFSMGRRVFFFGASTVASFLDEEICIRRLDWARNASDWSTGSQSQPTRSQRLGLARQEPIK